MKPARVVRFDTDVPGGERRTMRVTGSFAIVATVVILALGLAAGAASADNIYPVIDLGTLGGSSSNAYGLNNAGWTVGESVDGSGNWHAFRYANGAMEDLGTLGGTISQA